MADAPTPPPLIAIGPTGFLENPLSWHRTCTHAVVAHDAVAGLAVPSSMARRNASDPVLRWRVGNRTVEQDPATGGGFHPELRIRTDGGTTVVVQCQRAWDAPEGDRLASARLALSITKAAMRSVAHDRSAQLGAAHRLALAVAVRTAEAQTATPETVTVRLPSPFDPLQTLLWVPDPADDRTGGRWADCLDARHQAAWTTLRVVHAEFRLRGSGDLLVHLSAPSEFDVRGLDVEGVEADPMEAMRALAELPPAPAPRRVA